MLEPVLSITGKMLQNKTLGVAIACSAVGLVLQGCGDAPLVTTTPLPSSESEIQACLDGWEDPNCCCMTCDDSGSRTPVFAIRTTDECFNIGGQCKPPVEVFPNGVPQNPFTSYEEEFGSYRRPQVSMIEDLPKLEASSASEPSQFHLIGGHPDEIVIVFMLPGDKTPQTVLVRDLDGPSHFSEDTTVETYSAFQAPMGWNGFSGSQRGSEYFDCITGGIHYTNSSCYYTSEVIHSAHFTGLLPGTTYQYKLQTETSWGHTFKMPPQVGDPMKIVWTADLGQTSDSVKTMQLMRAQLDAGNVDLCVFPGDLAYADGYANDWDRYGRISEFLWSELPTAYGVGNHEATSGLENFAHFTPRYGWKSRRSEGTSSNWYSFDAGLAHIVTLCSYCDYTVGSPQYRWLEADLASVDRTQTPWVIVHEHTPWYTSNLVHPSATEGIQMRSQMEDVFYANKVDLVFCGHVHAYERTHPVYNMTNTCDGPVYITIGDGGNHEGPECGWVPGYEWSAKKEFSFGFGILSIQSATTANWAWHRNQDSADTTADSMDFTPARLNCPEKYVTV